MSPGSAVRDGEDDLAILHPERELVIAGEKVTVREYGFVEGLRLAPLAQPIVASLSGAFQSKSGVSLAAMRNAFAAYPEQVTVLIAESCVGPATTDEEKQSRPQRVAQMTEWVSALNDTDGDALLLLWQTVNMGFFVRRVAADFRSRKSMAMHLAGAMSTPPSPTTDTTRSGSATTPSVN